jgi:hypothetical protein
MDIASSTLARYITLERTVRSPFLFAVLPQEEMWQAFAKASTSTTRKNHTIRHISVKIRQTPKTKVVYPNSDMMAKFLTSHNTRSKHAASWYPIFKRATRRFTEPGHFFRSRSCPGPFQGPVVPLRAFDTVPVRGFPGPQDKKTKASEPTSCDGGLAWLAGWLAASDRTPRSSCGCSGFPIGEQEQLAARVKWQPPVSWQPRSFGYWIPNGMHHSLQFAWLAERTAGER